jgi:hypothetical protein
MTISLLANASIAASSATQAPEQTPALRISYSFEKYVSIEKFLKHPDFTPFEAQYRSGMQDLVQFVRDDVDGSEEKKDRATETLKGNFDIFLGKLFPKEKPGASQLIRMEQAYGRGKEALDLLSTLIADEDISKMQRIDAIRILAPDLAHCLDGSAKHLADCANDLQMAVGGESWAAFEQSRAEAYINIFLSSPAIIDRYALSTSNAIHRVIGVSNALADDFGLAMQKDSYAGESGITSELINECRQHLASTMAPDALAHAFSEKYLSEISPKMDKSFTGHNTSSAFDRVPYLEVLEHAMEKLASTNGLFGANCVVKPLDDSYSRLRLLKDPSLIAKTILEKKNGVPGPQVQPMMQQAVKRNILAGTLAPCIQTYGEKLFWKMDEDGDPQVLTISDFRHISLTGCDPNLAAFLNQAIKNSPPHALLEDFPASWLLKVDMKILSAQLDEDCFSAFLDIHKDAIKEMPFGERLLLMGNVIAHANPNCIKQFAGNIPVLFPGEANRDTALRTFLEIAVRRDNPDVTHAVRALSPSGRRPWEIALLKKNLPKALSRVSDERPAQLAGALFQWSEIAIEARENQQLTSHELKNIFQDTAPAFVTAMGSGNCARITAFGNVLLSAYQKGVLERKDIATLLTGYSDTSPLEMALRSSQAGAVEAFGNIVLACYDMGILTERQLANILACAPRGPKINPFILRTQRESLERADSATKAAFGTILQSCDSCALKR